jgi:hypothetical protein
MTSAFGKIVVASQLERSVRELLKEWFPTYLREVERQVGWDREPLAEPTSYSNRNSFDVEAGEEMPKVVVISPGLLEVPSHPEGNGDYNSVWQVGVGVAHASRNEEIADDVSKMYGAAVRAIVMQHQSLGREDVTGISWIDEGYNDLTSLENQLELYKSAEVHFGVYVEGVVNRWVGPPVPTEEATVLGEVDTVITEIPDYEKIVTNIP